MLGNKKSCRRNADVSDVLLRCLYGCSLHLLNTTVATGYHLVACVYGENSSEFSQSTSHSVINYSSREEQYLLECDAV